MAWRAIAEEFNLWSTALINAWLLVSAVIFAFSRIAQKKLALANVMALGGMIVGVLAMLWMIWTQWHDNVHMGRLPFGRIMIFLPVSFLLLIGAGIFQFVRHLIVGEAE